VREYDGGETGREWRVWWRGRVGVVNMVRRRVGEGCIVGEFDVG
jgi:hypothetical protein